MADPNDPVTIFISYSHLDEEYRSDLDKHLSGLKRRGLVSIWHDRRIGPGREWAGEIDDNLNAANIILLLISKNFMSSDYCYDIEMKRAMQRHNDDEAIVIPVVLKTCDWRDAPFSKLQAWPKDSKPINRWEDEDVAWLDVVMGIRNAVERIRPKTSIVYSTGVDRPKPHPVLLPYLCDRSEQEIELSEGVRSHRLARGSRPLVLLIHGDEWECHQEFIERIQTINLPKLYNLDPMSAKVRRAPNSMRPPRAAFSDREYWAYLGQALIGKSDAGKDEIFEYFSRQHEPLLIVLELLTEDFRGRGIGLLDSVVKFCAGWDDLPPERTVIFCISLKYQRLTGIRLWKLKLKALQRLNESLRKTIPDRYSSESRASVIAIPELESIPRGDVEAWRSSELVRERCRLTDRDIRALFDDRTLRDENGRIPMELLADKLKEFIE